MGNPIKFIDAKTFLGRAKTEQVDAHRPRMYRHATDARIVDRLFAGAMVGTKTEVEKMIARVERCKCSILFEDNARQPNYAPTVRLIGKRGDLLSALVVMANDYHPSEVSEVSLPPDGVAAVDLWWD